MSYIGYGEATGVDYSHVTLPIPGSPMPRSSFFTAAGVSYIMQSNSVAGVIFGGPPTFFVPAHGNNSITRYFGVGDGSGANAISIEQEVKGLPAGMLSGCVTVGDAPATAARVSVGTLTEGAISAVASSFVTDAEGCFRGVLPPGDYGIAATRDGTPYESNGTTPLVHAITITAGQSTVQNIGLPATGHVRVTVVDEQNAPVPARVAAWDSIPAPIFRSATRASSRPDERCRTAMPTSAIPRRRAPEFDLEPGTYQLVASRGVEYSYFSAAHHGDHRLAGLGGRADRARRRYDRLHLLGLPRARHRQR